MSSKWMDWTYEQKCHQAVEVLKKKGFAAVFCEDRQQAAKYIKEAAQQATTIGLGGSVSVQELSIMSELEQMGKELLNHGQAGLSTGQKIDIMRRQLTCDLFLAGTNALTLNGELVNIDATGNRVGAMFFGPKKIIVVAGRNKIVENRDEAVKRIKDYAAPANARRLGCKTPCAATGFCADCESAERICRITVIIDHLPRFSDITVLVVNEDMGL
ncbi:MAG: lactate utilization protein [Syntrophomonadaceae bacterium]